MAAQATEQQQEMQEQTNLQDYQLALWAGPVSLDKLFWQPFLNQKKQNKRTGRPKALRRSTRFLITVEEDNERPLRILKHESRRFPFGLRFQATTNLNQPDPSWFIASGAAARLPLILDTGFLLAEENRAGARGAS